MSDELAIVEAEEVQLGTLSASSPSDVIKRASGVSTELANIIKTRRLYKTIGGKNFVQVEGWSTLGAMLGVLPREKYVKLCENGYEAYVELVRANDGVIIGGASAICTRDERNWGNRDEYAVRSMAITRATGKAFRLGFSWIMTLAGYEVTPAEEMPDEQPKLTVKPPEPQTTDRPYTAEVVKAKVTEKAFALKQELAGGKRKFNPVSRQILAAHLTNIFPDDTQRYEMSGWLADKSSTKDMSPEYVLALMGWLGIKNFDDPIIPAASQEAQACHVAALKAKGQMEMPA